MTALLRALTAVGRALTAYGLARAGINPDHTHTPLDDQE